MGVAHEEEWPGFESGLTEAEFLDLKRTINMQFNYNGWFVKENVYQSLKAWADQLTVERLTEWVAAYPEVQTPKKVAIIMAGNIPLVGFHDFLSTVLSGNIAVCKLSSDDKTLLPKFLEFMVKWNPDFARHFSIPVGKLGEIEAVIATGSNNSQLYFEQYFGQYPHIFRKNRTSVAVLDGTETNEDFHQLGHDLFNYFGLGCRNVAHLLLPKGFDLAKFFEGIFEHGDVINHKKYGNNYDYNKAVRLMNKESLLDNNFVLLKEDKELFSPLAMIHYHFYDTEQDKQAYLEDHKEDIQVIVGKSYTPFGQAQSPKLTDYADGVDTLGWLVTL